MELKSHKKQKIDDGYGARFHRVYSIVIPAPFEKGVQVMRQMQSSLNDFSPKLLAKFEKVTGSKESLQKGDEFQIVITGPWNGPVRVASVHEHGFRFVTLEGHLEAGEIEFRILKKSENEFHFEIESMARSRDAVVDFVYDKIPIAKLAQTEMWISFCQHFAEQALNDPEKNQKPKIDDVQVVTERCDEETGQWNKI